MALSLQKKEKIVCKIREIAKNALSAVVASVHGVTANEINRVRKEARDINVCVCVVRNTLMQRIVSDTPLEGLRNILIGQNIVAFSMQQPRDAAHIFVKFSKNNDYFKIKGAFFEGKFIDASKISVLSELPNQKEAICRLITVLKTSSIGNLIRILRVLSDRN